MNCLASAIYVYCFSAVLCRNVNALLSDKVTGYTVCLFVSGIIGVSQDLPVHATRLHQRPLGKLKGAGRTPLTP